MLAFWQSNQFLVKADNAQPACRLSKLTSDLPHKIKQNTAWPSAQKTFVAVPATIRNNQHRTQDVIFNHWDSPGDFCLNKHSYSATRGAKMVFLFVLQKKDNLIRIGLYWWIKSLSCYLEKKKQPQSRNNKRRKEIKRYCRGMPKNLKKGDRNFLFPFPMKISVKSKKKVDTTFDVQFTARNQVKTKKKEVFTTFHVRVETKKKEKKSSRPQLIFQRGGSRPQRPPALSWIRPWYCASFVKSSK